MNTKHFRQRLILALWLHFGKMSNLSFFLAQWQSHTLQPIPIDGLGAQMFWCPPLTSPNSTIIFTKVQIFLTNCVSGTISQGDIIDHESICSTSCSMQLLSAATFSLNQLCYVSRKKVWPI